MRQKIMLGEMVERAQKWGMLRTSGRGVSFGFGIWGGGMRGKEGGERRRETLEERYP